MRGEGEGAAIGENRWQVVVPRLLRTAVLEACQSNFGVTKMLCRLWQSVRLQSSYLWTILPSSQRPTPSQTERLRLWQMSEWNRCLAGSSQPEPYIATREGSSSQRCSMPWASALGCRKFTQSHFTYRMFDWWSSLIGHWPSS